MEVDGVGIWAGSDPRDGKCAWDIILAFPIFTAAIRYFEAAKGAVATVGVKLSI